MNDIKGKLFVSVGILAALGSGAAWAAPAAADCGSVTAVQRRIVDHADEGWESLRSYVWRTNRIYGIDMFTVKDSLDGWRASVRCQDEVAAARARIDMAQAKASPAVPDLTAQR